MKKTVITASCIAVITLSAVILVSERDKIFVSTNMETIMKDYDTAVDIDYRTEENAVYKVISESLDVSYIHSKDEKRVNVSVDEEDDVEDLLTSEEKKKTNNVEATDICKVEDMTEDAAVLDNLVNEVDLIEQSQELAMIEELPMVESQQNVDIVQVDDNASNENLQAGNQSIDNSDSSVPSLVQDTVSTAAVVDNGIGNTSEVVCDEPIQFVGIEPVIKIELPVVRDEKK